MSEKRNIITRTIFLVLFVFANNINGEVRCIENERRALIKFKEGLKYSGELMSLWGMENECCEWEGVECSNTTGHVIALRIAGNYDYTGGGEISSALLELDNLEVLDLNGNDFGGNKIPEFVCSMPKLQHLSLSGSNFSGNVPPRLWNLTDLRTLDLSSNQFSGIVLSQLVNLTNLETLKLSANYFSGTVPPLIGNLNSLTTLDHSSNQFYGIVPPQLYNLTSLEILGMSKNRFSGSFPPQIGNLSNLNTLDLSSNHFLGIIPHQLWTLTNLETLDMSINNLTSSTTDWTSTSHVAPSLTKLNLGSNKLTRLPSSIWQLSNLEELVVSFNSLEDVITEAHLTKLSNLTKMDLSFNSLSLVISPGWIPPFQLSFIGLSGCKVGPHFPLWLKTQSDFTVLDLSLNGISGEVPKWLSSVSSYVYYLNVSYNHLSGTLSDFSSIEIEIFDVSSNKFSGHIPLFSRSTWIFRMSQNIFSGSLSCICDKISQGISNLGVLDVSNNQLEGKLPNCWENMKGLSVLNLANNNLSGEIPRGLGSLSNLMKLHLANNNLSGEFPSTLKNCKMLQLIDIEDNMLVGNIPAWIGDYHETISYLTIRNNRFHGSIPPQICHLSHIQVLDFSGNNISGKIPPCFDNFTNLVGSNTSSYNIPLSFDFSERAVEFIEYTTVPWKHKEPKYGRELKLLKLVDLSRNRLVGNIPRSFSSLRGLISLNLSRNSLTGIIDRDIGRMDSLECLDLSSNHLSGAIPVGMQQLNFLSVLDLANNNLSGKIPTGRHLQTLPASAYAGNIGLCGSPLPLCPGDSPAPSINSKSQNDDDGGILSLSFLKEVGISIILGFIFGFWGVVGSLIVKESWRRVFYNFWDAVGDGLSVRATSVWRKLRRS